MLKLVRENIWAIICMVVLVSWVGWAVFWRLDVASLQPWDEAWYGAISREMLKTAQPFHLFYNQDTYFDHPPLGFQLKALSMSLLGQSSFAVRLPEALSAILSVVLVYLIGSKISSRWAGFWGGVILLSSRWFLFRARSGNLDILLLTTQLLVFLALIYAINPHQIPANKKPSVKTFQPLSHLWILASWFFLSLSLLTKSLVSLQLLPVVLVVTIYYWRGYLKNVQTKAKNSVSWFFAGSCLALLIVPLLPWAITYLNIDAQYFIKNQLRIGFRTGTDKSINLELIKKVLLYFNSATHHWFKLMLGASGLMLGLLIPTQTRPKTLLLIGYVGLVALPYLISEKTEVWHLVPLIGAMAILTGSVIDLLIKTITNYLQKYSSKINFVVMTLLIRIIVTSLVIFIAVISYRDYNQEFINVKTFPNDFEKITWHITDRKNTVYATSDAYFPSLVYYANLQNAPVTYISDNEFFPICKLLAQQGKSLQAIGRFGDWLMSQGGDAYIKAREGNLVYVEINPQQCIQITKS